MKLLIDENLAPWLVEALSDLYPGSMHVRDVGLQRAHDGDALMDSRSCRRIRISTR